LLQDFVAGPLALAKRGGLDWGRLYEEAVREQVLARPDRASLLPPVEAVSPYG